MATVGFAVFETTIGSCGIAWSDDGLTGVQLPEHSERATRARMRRRWPGAVEAEPPAAVQRTIGSIVALLRGEAADLTFAALDPEGIPPFNRRVYQGARGIPPGETLTYGQLAARIGEADAARAVGQALGRNPFPLVVPCHRVVAAGGHPGGFSARGGAITKLRLLQIEGAVLGGQPTLFDNPGAGRE